MALDEPHNEDLLENVEDFTFQASNDVRSLIEASGGLNIDFIDSFFGSRLYVRLARSMGSCA